MASLRQHHQLSYDRLSSDSLYSATRRRGSTSQMGLHKILTIITTVQPPLAAVSPPLSGSDTKESSEANDKNRGCEMVDLNVGFRTSPELKESFEADASAPSSITSTAVEGGGRDGGGLRVDLLDGCDRQENEEHGNGVSEISHIQIEEAEKKSLTLLIEAAELIFGELNGDVSESARASELKKDEPEVNIEASERKFRRKEMGGELEVPPPPPSPVVRSKRGRSRVLPCKYRDSVLEPLTRSSGHRSSILTPKRRRR